MKTSKLEIITLGQIKPAFPGSDFLNPIVGKEREKKKRI